MSSVSNIFFFNLHVFSVLRLDQAFSDAFSRDCQLIKADPKHGVSVTFIYLILTVVPMVLIGTCSLCREEALLLKSLKILLVVQYCAPYILSVIETIIMYFINMLVVNKLIFINMASILCCVYLNVIVAI